MTEKKDLLQKNYVVALLAMVCCLLWGSAFPCVKAGYAMFNIQAADTASQIVFAGVRFTLAGILTIIIGSGLGKECCFLRRLHGEWLLNCALPRP